ncbi:MAG: FecR domain-containing protein [Pirellulales bacterium]|nr:FecR domain-containing protein [Pirellulales bacterium]
MAARNMERAASGGSLGPAAEPRPMIFPAIDFDQELPDPGFVPRNSTPVDVLDAGGAGNNVKSSIPWTLWGLTPYKWFAVSWVAALCITLTWIWIHESGGPVGEFATLVQTDGCVWTADRVAPQQGERLSVNDGLELVRGIAEIEFDNGTRVVLEGPAQLSFEKPDRVACNRGSLVATVPREAIGFTVRTPLANVVDLGTEFGVAVEPNGESEVYVFQGAVRLKSSPDEKNNCAPPVELHVGEARRVQKGGIITNQVRVRPSSYVRSGARKVSHRQVVVSTTRGHGADAYVHSLNSNNYGGHPALGVKATYKDTTRRKAWIRFDVADPSAKPSQLCCASLQLTVAEPQQTHKTLDPNMIWDFTVWGLKDVRHGSTADGQPGEGGWIEGTGSTSHGQPIDGALSWTNASGNQLADDGLDPQRFVFLGRFQIMGPGMEGQTIQLSTSALRDFIADDSNGLVTLVVLRATPQPAERESTIHWFASKEHDRLTPPQLKLDYEF